MVTSSKTTSKTLLKQLAKKADFLADYGNAGPASKNKPSGIAGRLPKSPKADTSHREERLMVLGKFEPSGSADTRKMQESFRNIAGIELPFADHEDVVSVRKKLVTEFPYASSIIDRLLSATLRRHSVRKFGIEIMPTILWGPPGLGKSRLARRVCEELGIPHRVISASGMVDDQILGVARGFSSGVPSLMTELFRDYEVANPVIVIDEIDKVVTDSRNGNIVNKLLPLLEKAEATSWHDGFFGLPVNVSAISWIFTANEVSGLPRPFRSRVQAIKMPAPDLTHLAHLLSALRKEFAEEEGIDPRWLASLDHAEHTALAESYANHRSVRILKAQYRQILSLRDLTMQ